MADSVYHLLNRPLLSYVRDMIMGNNEGNISFFGREKLQITIGFS